LGVTFTLAGLHVIQVVTERVSMKLYYAPMEGITNVFYRRLHHKYFTGVDRYFTPFIGVYPGHFLKKRDEREIDPAANEGINTVPQILTNNAAEFVWLYRKLRSMGYEEVNLNLGCPSGTVVAKGRGAGFLRYPNRLEEFLKEVFDSLGNEAEGISLKTRTGLIDPSEMERLSEIYSEFPVKELTVHPRVRKQFYKGVPDLNAFEKALVRSACPVCYNGDIYSVSDYNSICSRFLSFSFADGSQKLSAIMLGRGIVSNPALAREIKEGRPLEKNEFRSFLEELENLYREEFTTDKNVFFKMKEMWSYMSGSFVNSEKYLKQLLKASDWQSFRAAEKSILTVCRIKNVTVHSSQACEQ
jgi:tRNA-dihydrouridine synthase